MPAELTIAFHGKTVIYAFIAIESMDLVAGVARITRLQKGMVILDCPITRFCGSGTVGRRQPYSITSKYPRSFRSSDHLSGCYSMTKHPIKPSLRRIAMLMAFVFPLTLQAGEKEKSRPAAKSVEQSAGNQTKMRTKKSIFSSRTEITPPNGICPVPVPAYVGHTTVTYGPFMPQHMLYPHVDTYRHTENDGKTVYRTRAAYRTSLQARMRNLQWSFLRLPR